jgi:hypothetical protein
MRKALTHRPEYEVRPLGDEQLHLLLHRSAIVDARSRALRHEALDNDELDKAVEECIRTEDSLNSDLA